MSPSQGSRAVPLAASPAATAAKSAPSCSAGVINWPELVERIKAGDDAGMAELYRLFSMGVRFHLCRHLGAQDVDDKIHDIFLIVIQAIRKGELREPERLMGFVRTIVRRQLAGYIEQVMHARREQVDLDSGINVSDRSASPEDAVILRERREIMGKMLRSLPARDREILRRFYLLEQTQERICREMNLSETQFRLLKSRAKARFGELGQHKLQRRLRKMF